jgi:hypothetical protein
MIPQYHPKRAHSTIVLCGFKGFGIVAGEAFTARRESWLRPRRLRLRKPIASPCGKRSTHFANRLRRRVVLAGGRQLWSCTIRDGANCRLSAFPRGTPSLRPISVDNTRSEVCVLPFEIWIRP